MSSRTWIKVYCDKWLEGTISEESISVRGVWISLLALAGNGKYGDSGEIKALDGVGFNNNQVAAMLKISLNLWVATKKQLIKTGRIIEQPPQKPNENHCQPPETPSKEKSQPPPILVIVNWKKYQSEYERTSKYRSKDTAKATTNDTALEDRGKRIDNRVYKETTKEKQFNTLWEAYPRKKNKGQAEKAFFKINPDEQLLGIMLVAIKQAKESVAWQKEDGEYIPYPATWLNARGWEDEIKKGGRDGAHRGSPRQIRPRETYTHPGDYGT